MSKDSILPAFPKWVLKKKKNSWVEDYEIGFKVKMGVLNMRLMFTTYGGQEKKNDRSRQLGSGAKGTENQFPKYLRTRRRSIRV